MKHDAYREDAPLQIHFAKRHTGRSLRFLYIFEQNSIELCASCIMRLALTLRRFAVFRLRRNRTHIDTSRCRQLSEFLPLGKNARVDVSVRESAGTSPLAKFTRRRTLQSNVLHFSTHFQPLKCRKVYISVVLPRFIHGKYTDWNIFTIFFHHFHRLFHNEK